MNNTLLERESEMREKYEYGWWNFRSISRDLVSKLTAKYGEINESFLHELNKSLSKPCPICGRYHTPRDYVSIYFICKDCLEKLPGYEEWKSGNFRSLIIDTCDKHGFYVSSQPNGNHRVCPTCVTEAKTVTCEVCGKTYESKDKHIGRIINGETNNVCDDCQRKLPGFDGWKKNKNLRWCKECNSFILTSHNFDNCPVCKSGMNSYKIKCKRCDKTAYVNNAAKAYCKECEFEVFTSEACKDYIKKEKSQFTQIVGDLMLLPIDSYKDKNQWQINTVKTCSCCGRLYVAHSGNSTTCGRCFKIVECNECGGKYLVLPKTYNYNTDGGKKEWDGSCSRSCAASHSGKRLWSEKGHVNAPGAFTPTYPIS